VVTFLQNRTNYDEVLPLILRYSSLLWNDGAGSPRKPAWGPVWREAEGYELSKNIEGEILLGGKRVKKHSAAKQIREKRVCRWHLLHCGLKSRANPNVEMDTFD